VTGKLRQVSRSTRKGIAEARRLRAKLVTEVAQGKHGGTSGTFGSLLDDWLTHGGQLGRSPTTLDGYRKKIERTIRPALGSVQLEKITAHTLDAFYGQLLDQGTKPATVLHHHRIISAALATAERWGWVDRNVANLARPPAARHKAVTAPPPERVRALIEQASVSRSPELATIITLAALTGLRRGELCGLRWSDLDRPNSQVTVRRSIWQTRDGWGEKPPKTHQIRQLMLGEYAMGILADRWERVTTATSLAEVPLAENAYIVSADVTGQRPLLPDTVTQAFHRLCQRMERPALDVLREANPDATRHDLPAADRWPYCLHDLRHYTATELFRAGHNPRTVADRLGHADAAMTLRVYTHDTHDQARAAADTIESGIRETVALAI
jgi:integrase